MHDKGDIQRFLLDLLKENVTLRTTNAVLEGKKTSLEQEISRLEQEAEDHRRELLRLRTQLAAVHAVNEGFSERFAKIMRQNADLESLHRAGCKLCESLYHRSELLQAIDEIIVSLIGTEHYGVFELSGSLTAAGRLSAPREEVLELVLWSRIDPRRYHRIPLLGCGLIGRVAATGEPHLPNTGLMKENGGSGEEPVACIPLKLGSCVIGAIALFQLPPQKSQGFEDHDLDVLELLASRAATALYCSNLHTRLRAKKEVFESGR